jgi:hypothetical protein
LKSEKSETRGVRGQELDVRRKTIDVRRKMADGGRRTDDGRANPRAVVVRRWSVVGCANAVIPATSGRPESDGAGRFTTKTPREDSQGGKGGKGEKIITTKAQRARRTDER